MSAPPPAAPEAPAEVAILARVLGNGDGKLPAAVARYVVRLTLSEGDRARMHELAVRNQADDLSPAEKGELFAYAKAGTLLSILKSKARRALRGKPSKRPAS
jgi:hypothetical protein